MEGLHFASAGQVSIAGALSVWSTACTGRKRRLRKSEMRSKRPTTLHLAQVFADREQGRRLAYMSEMSCRIQLEHPSQQENPVPAGRRHGPGSVFYFFPKKTSKNGNYFAVPDCFAALFWPGQVQMSEIWSNPFVPNWKKSCGSPHFTMWALFFLAFRKCITWPIVLTRRTATNQATVLSIFACKQQPQCTSCIFLLTPKWSVSIHVLILALSAQWGMALERASKCCGRRDQTYRGILSSKVTIRVVRPVTKCWSNGLPTWFAPTFATAFRFAFSK